MGVLRLVLALSVVAAHAGDYWPTALSGVGGSVAVEIFFVMSGFYMALVLSRTYAGRTKAFLLNRGLRIYPEYWLVAVGALVFGELNGANWLGQLASLPSAAIAILIVANTAIFGSSAVMFLQVNYQGVDFGPFLESNPPLFTLLLLPQAWTLAMELIFYILAPWLVRRSTCLIAVVVVALFGCKILVAGFILQLPDPWTNRFIVFELAYFLAGILLFRYWSTRKEQWTFQRAGKGSWIPLAIAGTIVLIAPWIHQFGYQYGSFVSEYLTPLILVASFAVLIPALFSATRSSKWDSRVGEFSYPVYLSHLLALGMLSALGTRVFLNSGFTFAAALVLVFSTAWVVVAFGHRLDHIRDRVRGEPSPIRE